MEIQGYRRLFDLNFVVSSICPDDDQCLYDKQKAYATVVLTKLMKTTQGLHFLSVHEGHPCKQLLLYYRAHVLKSTNTGTIILQGNAALYNHPINKHQGSQVSFLNLVSENFMTMVSFGHNIDAKTKITTVQYLLMSQPNLHQTQEDPEKLNLINSQASLPMSPGLTILRVFMPTMSPLLIFVKPIIQHPPNLQPVKFIPV